MHRTALALALCPVLALAGPHSAIPIPVPVQVLSVHDGDTITVRQLPSGPVRRVRVALIDAPEIGRGPHGARCQAERDLGLLSRDAARALLGAAQWVELIRLRPGAERYHRDLASVRIDGHIDLGTTLIAWGLARPYRPAELAAGPACAAR